MTTDSHLHTPFKKLAPALAARRPEPAASNLEELRLNGVHFS